MFKEILDKIDTLLTNLHPTRPCILITGEVSAGKTRVLSEFLSQQNIPETLRPCSSLEPQTSIPLVISQDTAWKLSLCHNNQPIRELPHFPDRADLSKEDIQLQNHLSLQGPIWKTEHKDVDIKDVDIIDLRGWSEKEDWQQEVEYLQHTLENRRVIGIFYVIQNRNLKVPLQSPISPVVYILHEQQKMVEDCEVLSIITKLPEHHKERRLEKFWEGNFSPKIQAEVSESIAYLDPNPLTIDLHDDIDAKIQADFRNELSDQIHKIIDKYFEYNPPVKVDTGSTLKALQTFQQLLADLQIFTDIINHEVTLRTNKTKVNGLSAEEIETKLRKLLTQEYAKVHPKQTIHTLSNRCSTWTESLSEDCLIKEWSQHFIQPSLDIIVEEFEKWNQRNQHILQTLSANMGSQESFEKTSQFFRSRQQHPPLISYHLEYLNLFKTTDTSDDVFIHLEQLFTTSILIHQHPS